MDSLRIAEEITRGFTRRSFDLSARPNAEAPGWDALPESQFAAKVRSSGESAPFVRAALTFVCAMDRMRVATRLRDAALKLYYENRWAFVPALAAGRSFEDLATVLRQSGVSQRHGLDSNAWRRIAESLLAEPTAPVSRVIHDGVGVADELIATLKSARSAAGVDRYPMLRGPKIGPMWVRMMVYPGEARVSRIEHMPIAVDVQVKRATECLGLTDTANLSEDAARAAIQDAWRVLVAKEGAQGPEGLRGTSAALDPALWYFGRIGCSRCTAVGHQLPISPACKACQLSV